MPASLKSPNRRPDGPEPVPRPPALPPAATPGQQWRFARNLAICDLYLNCGGRWSQRALADVFDLPRSRVAEIVREFRALAER